MLSGKRLFGRFRLRWSLGVVLPRVVYASASAASLRSQVGLHVRIELPDMRSRRVVLRRQRLLWRIELRCALWIVLWALAHGERRLAAQLGLHLPVQSTNVQRRVVLLGQRLL